MSLFHGIEFIDAATGIATGFINNSGAPQICAQDYLLALAEGDIADHEPWSIIGYTPTFTTVESTIWSKAGVHTFPAAAQQMEMVSSDNTQDIGTILFNSTSTGGSTTTLIDTEVDFTAGGAAGVGDCVILDKSGAVPEWGYVTEVTDANTLTIAGGFSSGGTGDTRAYLVVDYSAYTGAHAVIIEYLNGSYVEDTEIVVLNGTTAVDTVQTDLFRPQGIAVIAAGSGMKAVGNLSLRNTAGSSTFQHITAGYTHSRSGFYTVPATKTLYVVSMTAGYGYATNQTHYGRIYLRANYEEHSEFHTGSLMHPYAEATVANSAFGLDFKMPLVFPATTDIRVAGISTFSGIGEVALRGWLE